MSLFLNRINSLAAEKVCVCVRERKSYETIGLNGQWIYLERMEVANAVALRWQ